MSNHHDPSHESRPSRRSARGADKEAARGEAGEPLLEIGILTIGKPTLAMALSSLLLQDERRIRIHIVDTAPSPIIDRTEVQSALRLAADRHIICSYDHLHDDKRAFSLGRLALLEALKGHNICFMDDDVVMPSQALTIMLEYIGQHPEYGWLAPYCKNAGTRHTHLAGTPHYSPGGVFRQDAIVRNILLEYYETTVDVLDRQSARQKVWEIAFLTDLFPLLNRETHVQDSNVIYHLDYNERPNWDLLREDLSRHSHQKAVELVDKYTRVMGQ
ncbi:MAG: glycosyltransferase family A protein [Chloroflexia bacterium]